MRLIDADDFGNRMYHEAFEKDSDLQKWDSGCWIRYKLFEKVLREQPTVQPDHVADIGKKVSISCGRENDLISRQAALDAIDECFKKVVRAGNMSAYEYDNAYAQGEIDAYVMAIDTVKILTPVQPEPKWISCNERLPKEKQSVLVTDGSVVLVCDIISTDEGYKWEDSHGYWLDLAEWTAWMPLPEPYRGGEK